MTHFFPGGITENLLEQSLGGTREASRAAPHKERRGCQSSIKTFFCKGLSGVFWFIKFPHGPAREKEQQGCTRKAELGGTVEGGSGLRENSMVNNPGERA